MRRGGAKVGEAFPAHTRHQAIQGFFSFRIGFFGVAGRVGSALTVLFPRTSQNEPVVARRAVRLRGGAEGVSALPTPSRLFDRLSRSIIFLRLRVTRRGGRTAR